MAIYFNLCIIVDQMLPQIYVYTITKCICLLLMSRKFWSEFE